MRRLIGIIGLLLLVGITEAQLVKIGFTATVKSVNDYEGVLDGAVQVGDKITGQYIYDTGASDSNASSTIGDYYYYSSPCGVQVNAGELVFQSNPSNLEFLVEIGNNHEGVDFYSFRSYNNLPLSNGIPVGHIYWHLVDYLGQALSSTTLPLTTPVLTDYQSPSINISGDRTGDKTNYYSITADITSVYLIPEPMSLGLLALGGLLLRRNQR